MTSIISERTELSSSNFSMIAATPPYSSRLIEISLGELDYQFNVPGSSHYHVARSRDKFLSSITSEKNEEPASLTELIARFLLFVIEHEELWTDAPPTAHDECVELLLRKLETDFMRGADVHTLAANLPGTSSQRQAVVRAYFTAIAYVRSLQSPVEHETALFPLSHSSRDPKVFAIFGGQGNTTDYLAELRSLYSTYTHLIEPLLTTANQTLRHLLSVATVTRLRQFHQGLDVLQWLQRPETTPEPEYLLSAPVSFPLIGLVQFANYAVMCHVLGKPPGQLIHRFLGMAGHSQGVITAATIAMATTWESFEVALETALTLLFHVGSSAQEATPQITVPSNVSTESVKNSEGFPTPMLNVSGCRRSQLQKYIDGVNGYLEPHQRASISLINGQTNFVVSGPVLSLCALTANLRKVKAAPGLEQDKIAFSSRKPQFSVRFLPISAPFHSKYLADAAADAIKALSYISIKPSDLLTSVYHSKTGEDLRLSTTDNIVPDLIRMIHCELDDWPRSTVFPGATHVLDFGPGGLSGVGSLLHRTKEGTGVRVIFTGLAEGTSPEFGYRSDIFERDPRKLIWGENWETLHAPRLVRTPNGALRIDNAMTRLLGVPPLMVAGMTPTTVSWEFVSSVINSGYHVELAGGGYYNAEQMTTAIKNLQQNVPAGRGICINAIYASPKQVRWQVPLIQKLRAEGVPIDGLTFGAGVPSVEVAKEYIDTLNLRYMAFKPGSAFAINQVISIAKANEGYPILLQWTGGRGGGHHSYEDFHDPILKLYAKIRRCPNIVLLAGSGFGGAEDTYPYLSGKWSVQLGYPAMPFDGVLFGSRVMVAKEAKTSRGAKEVIVAAPGVDDPASWEQSYHKPTGGVITVKSEMGEPIHKMATRGVLLWKEMDDKIFSISDKPKRLEALRQQRDYIIQRLNNDFQKVWFGRDTHNKVVDLEDMTYAEVLRRLVELLYVTSESRWIDPTYIKLTADFVRRMYSRLLSSMPSMEIDFGLEDPALAIPTILSHCPKAEKQVITFNDARYFVLLCKRPGFKPPTFVPALDDDFEFWFKKDSLWQSEDLAAVVGQDAQRTCILQGPVAVKYCTMVDEPVADILGRIGRTHIDKIFQDRYSGRVGQIAAMDASTCGEEPTVATPARCEVTRDELRTYYQIDSSCHDDELPEIDHWLSLFAGRSGTWIHALLTSKDVTQGDKVISNPIRRILSPVQGMRVEVTESDNPEDISIAIAETESEQSYSSRVAGHSVVIRKEHDILVTFYTDETVEGVTLPLTFKFNYHPNMTLHPIHEVMEGRNDRLRNFYYRLWFGLGRSVPQLTIASASPVTSPVGRRPSRPFDVSDFQSLAAPNMRRPTIALNTALASIASFHTELETPADLQGASFKTISPTNVVFRGRDMIVSSPTIQDFSESIEQSFKAISSRSDQTMASLDFAIVVGWEAMMKAIFPQAINGEFLNLVHLSNKFNLLNDSTPLTSRDQINSNAEILAIKNEPAGRVVEVGAIIERDGNPVLELVSEFLFRGSYTDYSVCFEKKTEQIMCVELDTPAKVAVLKSKPWFHVLEHDTDLLGLKLIFELKSLNKLESATTYRSMQTFGQVYYEPAVTKRRQRVAKVQFQSGKAASNPVMEYLKRNGFLYETTHHQENPQPLGEQDWLRITAPATNQAYARASGDFNPIHVSRPFAKYANLPGTITHGMYTSAAVRQLVEKAAGSNEEVRMRSYEASFVSMVLPGDSLDVQVTHVGMKKGLRVLSFQAVNVHTGDKVLVGEAEVDQPLSAYIFTGQGSQKPDMGMDLYATCEIAKSVWDAADKFYNETYGFLISDIVKRNPKELTVHFGGRRGHRIRQNYIGMTVESNGRAEKFFKSIDETTTSYTFRHKAGLLFSTEFAQPALTVMERAQFLHLRSKGLVSDTALFAGHSLGEYTALSTIGEIMPFEKLLSVVFYRGLTMQSAVARDAKGLSRFSMMAVNPSRVSRALTTKALQQLVIDIANATNDLLEVVNYNVEGQQYVCAGTRASLDCLAMVTTHIAKNPKDFQPGNSDAEFKLRSIISNCAAEVSMKAQPIPLTRGVASIPLEGIDVPFHSSFLLTKMPAFRRVLQRFITVDAIDAERLVGKYVSNVTGKPFDLSLPAIKEVYDKTQSFVLKDLIQELETQA